MAQVCRIGPVGAASKTGFTPVGVLRSFGRNPDGGWHDGLLMDLIVLDGEWT